MKKILTKIFPILGEKISPEWMDEDNIVYKMNKFMFFLGGIIGAIVTMIIIKIITNI